MNFNIDSIHELEYPQVVELWEASVRATHHFLKDEDIAYFKPLILNEFLKAVTLTCIRDQDKVVGFAGVLDGKLEMLFIHPDYFGKGIGKILLKHAVKNHKIHQVDVNEDNVQAVNFYKHMGFKVIGRSEVDAMGKPFPILHMAF